MQVLSNGDSFTGACSITGGVGLLKGPLTGGHYVEAKVACVAADVLLGALAFILSCRYWYLRQAYLWSFT
jgi:hypothetical protein